MEIRVAQTAGFCFGVKRALEMVATALAEPDGPIYSLGPLIHNPQVVRELTARGLTVADRIEAVASGRVVVRSHGAEPEVYQAAAARGLTVIDATCPFVKKVQQLAVLLQEQGYQVVICGERDHAEVQGVLAAVGGAALVLNQPQDLGSQLLSAKVGLLSQTTQNIHQFQRLIEWLVPQTQECRVFNTICSATSERQEEAARLSREVDLMIVVGGRNSANTARLTAICRESGTPSFQVEGPEELEPSWFNNKPKIGVTAGASTPQEQIVAVIELIKTGGGKKHD